MLINCVVIDDEVATDELGCPEHGVAVVSKGIDVVYRKPEVAVIPNLRVF